MNVTVETYGQSIVLNCKGELTADSLDAFRRAVEHQMSEDQLRDLVLDFEQVPFVDSAGLEYLLGMQETLGERLGQVKLAKLDENVAKIMEITRLDSAFERFDDINQAVRAV